MLTGDPAATADEFRELFLGRLRQWTQGRSLLRAANEAGMHQGVPGCFVYLLVTCIVASEAQEDRHTPGEVERDFRDGLCTLLGDRIHDSNLDLLPGLWQGLAQWTAAPGRPDGSRRLILPDPGNETLIGYSKRLVFPSVRDQKLLARLLSGAGLLMEDPPVNLLLGLLARARRELTQDLSRAVDDFTDKVRRDPFSREIADHHLMTAVNASVRNAPLLLDDASGGADVTLLLLDYADSFEFILAATSETPFPGADAVADGFLPPEWPYRVETVAGRELVVERVLAGEVRCPLSWVITPGVIPFATSESGVPEVISRGRLEDVSYVLIRNDRQASFCSAFGVEPAELRRSGMPEWSVARSPALIQLTSEQLDDVGLADVVVLHQRPTRNVLRLRDGYGVLGQFLGFRTTTPWIDAPGAVSVAATLDGAELSLRSNRDGWRLPDRDLLGRLEVVARFPSGRPQQRHAELVLEPLVTTYKQPSDPMDWMVETLAGSTVLGGTATIDSAPVEAEIPDALHRIFLGPVVGEFLVDDERAAWELSSFGSMFSLRTIGDPDSISPTGRVEDPGLCRTWRRILNRHESDAVDDATRRAASRARAAKGLPLEVVTSPGGHTVRGEQFPAPDQGCRIVQAALGTYSARRAGMPIVEWYRLLESAFGIDYQLRRLVHRAWQEAGFIDEARRLRWSGGAVFARSPFIWTFRSGGAQYGSIEGLVMPTRLVQLEALATEMGLACSSNPSPSRYLPPRLMVRSADGAVADFAARAGLEVRHLAASPTVDVARREQHQRSIPLGYDSQKAFPTFPVPEGVQVRMHTRPRAPRFWSASFGSRTIWSYSPEALQFWICRESGLPSSEIGSGPEIQARGSFLPLSIARWLSSVSGVSPGPIGGSYLNVASSRRLAERVLHVVASLPSIQDFEEVSND